MARTPTVTRDLVSEKFRDAFDSLLKPDSRVLSPRLSKHALRPVSTYYLTAGVEDHANIRANFSNHLNW